MNETINEFGFFEDEDVYFEFPISIEIDSWEKEQADSQYPGCSAGAEICDIVVAEQPQIEDVRKAIQLLSGDEKTSVFECNGIEYDLDFNNGVSISEWNNDVVLDSLV